MKDNTSSLWGTGQSLKDAKSAWVLFYEHVDGSLQGHMISVIKTGPNEFVKWDADETAVNKLENVNIKQLADYVDERRLKTVNNVEIFSFT